MIIFRLALRACPQQARASRSTPLLAFSVGPVMFSGSEYSPGPKYGPQSPPYVRVKKLLKKLLGRYWRLLGSYWQLVAVTGVYGSYWWLLAVAGGYWVVLLAVTCSHWAMTGVYGSYW